MDSSKIKDSYQRALFKYFYDNKKKIITKDEITPKVFFDLYESKKETQNETDKIILENFIKIRHAVVDIDAFKPISNFLNGKSTALRYNETADLLAYLIDYPNRPISKFRKYLNNLKDDKNRIVKNNEKTEAKKDNDSLIVKMPDVHITNNILSSFDFKPLHKLIYVILFLLIVILIVFIFLMNEKKDISINSKNFNVNNHYYYYNENGKIKLVEKPDKTNKKAQPVTPIILDEYFYQQGIDTTQPEVKAIKINYFKQHSTPQIINVDTGQPVSAKQDKQVEVKKVIKVANKTDKKVKVKADNKGIIGEILPDKIYQKYRITEQDHFSYRPSQKFKNQTVCDYDLDYEIQRGGKLQKRHLSVSAAGFSKQSAKKNARNKMRLLLKEELKNLAL